MILMSDQSHKMAEKEIKRIVQPYLVQALHTAINVVLIVSDMLKFTIDNVEEILRITLTCISM